MFAAQLLIGALAFTGTHAVRVQEDLRQHGEINLAQGGLPGRPSQSTRPDEQMA